MDQAPETWEQFTVFPVAPETTDLGLNIPLDECRGLSYDIYRLKPKVWQKRLHHSDFSCQRAPAVRQYAA